VGVHRCANEQELAAMNIYYAMVLTLAVWVLAVLQGVLFDGSLRSNGFLRLLVPVFWVGLMLGHFAVLLFISARPDLVRLRNVVLWNLSFLFCLYGLLGAYVFVAGG
jgi:hypothetical protein